ncbi:hypothetical protein C0J52_25914 [Blattella germanica]|nr:hypothetical protein C0J52_25914 [Blattella germanica]
MEARFLILSFINPTRDNKMKEGLELLECVIACIAAMKNTLSGKKGKMKERKKERKKIGCDLMECKWELNGALWINVVIVTTAMVSTPLFTIQRQFRTRLLAHKFNEDIRLELGLHKEQGRSNWEELKPWRISRYKMKWKQHLERLGPGRLPEEIMKCIPNAKRCLARSKNMDECYEVVIMRYVPSILNLVEWDMFFRAFSNKLVAYSEFVGFVMRNSAWFPSKELRPSLPSYHKVILPIIIPEQESIYCHDYQKEEFQAFGVLQRNDLRQNVSANSARASSDETCAMRRADIFMDAMEINLLCKCRRGPQH